MTSNGRPLEGTVIVDLTSNFTGPMATMLLADQGAEVVKVEAPEGDVMRKLGARSTGGSPYFANLNRGKRSVAVDLTTDAGREVVLGLVDRAAVFVQNFRPGVADRLGLGPDVLMALDPRLVYVSISGYGTVGPRAEQGAYDHVVQALSGMAGLQAGRDGPPELIRHGVVDKSTAYAAAQAIVAALLQRERSGRGSHVELSMLDVALHFLWPDGMADLTCLEGEPVPSIARSFRLTPTADGHVSIVAITDAQWRGLLEAAGCTEALADPELQTLTGRHRKGGETMRSVSAALARMSTAEVLARLEANDVPSAPALATRDVVVDPQVVAAGTLEEIDHPELGRIRQPRPPARFDGAAPLATASPSLGEHTDAVLAELGWSDEDVAAARAGGAVL